MEWAPVQLGDILSLEYGRSLPARERDGHGDFCVAGSNGPDGKHSEALVSGPGIVVGRKGSAGKVSWYNTDFWPIDTTYYVVPKVPLDIRWLYYRLSSLSLERLATTTGVPGLNRNDTYALPILLPPPSEQHRIVDILEQADHLRHLRARADAKAERILPALFLKMFGDAAPNSREWDVVPLQTLLSDSKGALQSGPFGSHLHNHDFVDDGEVLAVGVDNVHDSGFDIGRNRRITSEKYDELKKYTLEPGDVLITIMGTIGRTCVFPAWAIPAICTKHVYRIQLDRQRLVPEYLVACLRFSTDVRAQLGASTTGQIVAGIKSSDLRQLRIKVPPVKMQSRYAAISEKLRGQLEHVVEASTAIDRLFTLIIHRAFSGDLTAKWREAHMKELLREMEHQAKALQSVTA